MQVIFVNSVQVKVLHPEEWDKMVTKYPQIPDKPLERVDENTSFQMNRNAGNQNQTQDFSHSNWKGVDVSVGRRMASSYRFGQSQPTGLNHRPQALFHNYALPGISLQSTDLQQV